MFKRLTKSVFALLLSLACAVPVSTIKATASEQLPPEIEEIIKEEIYKLSPEKFPERSISQLSLEEVEARTGRSGTAVKHGNPVTQYGTYIGLHKNTFWAMDATGVIDVTDYNSFSVSFSTSYTFNKTASVNGTISYGGQSSETHHVSSYKGKICAVGVFADVTAQEWDVYVYDNYSGHLISQSKSTTRSVSDTWLNGVYKGQVVYKFYNLKFTL